MIEIGQKGWVGQRESGVGRRRWGGQRGMGWAESGGRAEGAIVLKEREGVIGLRERSDRLAASVASRAVQDRAPRSEAQRSAVQTARKFIMERREGASERGNGEK